MSTSKIDKRIRNARLAVKRAGWTAAKTRAERELADALADKERMKVTHR